MKGRCLLLAVAIAVSGAPGLARADQKDVEGARSAYDRGAAAYDAGDYKLAAAELTRADDLAPNDIALELALKAAVKADDARLAMALSRKADARQATGSLAAARDAARSKMAARTGQVLVSCAAGTLCTATVDGAPYPVGVATYLLVGDHRVVIDTSGHKEAFAVRVDPFAAVDVVAKGPAVVSAVPRSPADDGRRDDRTKDGGGLAPGWFFAAAGVTTLLGAGAIVSAIDLGTKHDTFVATPSEQGSLDGESAQVRTNVLIGVASVSVVATAVIGIFFTRWTSERPTSSATR
jgi:hypothetical protein